MSSSTKICPATLTQLSLRWWISLLINQWWMNGLTRKTMCFSLSLSSFIALFVSIFGWYNSSAMCPNKYGELVLDIKTTWWILLVLLNEIRSDLPGVGWEKKHSSWYLTSPRKKGSAMDSICVLFDGESIPNVPCFSLGVLYSPICFALNVLFVTHWTWSYLKTQWFLNWEQPCNSAIPHMHVYFSIAHDSY